MTDKPLTTALLLIHDVLKETAKATTGNRQALLHLCDAIGAITADLPAATKQAVDQHISRAIESLKDEQQ